MDDDKIVNDSKSKKAFNILKQKEFWTILLSVSAIVISVFTYLNTRDQLHTAQLALEATTRPYLSIESVTEEDNGDENVYILVGVINLGQLPATNVDVTSIRIDKEEWKGTQYIQTPTWIYASDNVTITINGWIIVTPEPPERRDFPSSIVFYPQKLSRFVIPVSRDQWETSVHTGSVIELKLEYSWGKNDYWYVATYLLDTNGEWNISLERGN
jgi:hypothetical protein